MFSFEGSLEHGVSVETPANFCFSTFLEVLSFFRKCGVQIGRVGTEISFFEFIEVDFSPSATAFCIFEISVFHELFEAYVVCVVQPGGTLPVSAWPGVFFGEGDVRIRIVV